MTPKQMNYEHLAKTVIKKFEKRGIEGFYCATSKEAVEQAMKLMKEDSVVAFGGSQTLIETGMMDALAASSHTVIDRTVAKTPDEQREIFAKSVMADDYLMSSNAITIDGELVNIDGNGNRVACLITGPKQVIILAGMNKLTRNVQDAVNRVRNIAAPPNGVRLDTKTPCSVKGICVDCHEKNCMCSHIVITRHSKIPGRIKVILIGEMLGY